MVSKFIYKFKSLPSPPIGWFHSVQRFFNDYLWAHGIHHIPAERTYLPISEGGLNHIDFYAFNKALKLSWLHAALQKPTAFWSVQLQSCLKISLRDFLCCNIKPADLKLLYVMDPLPFWKEILGYWCNLHYTKMEGDIHLMPIAYNSVLKQGQLCSNVFNPDYIQKLYDIDISTVKDIVDEYDFLTLCQKNDLHVNKLVDILPSGWLTQVDSDNYLDVVPIEMLLLKGLPVHSCYNLLIHSRKLPVSRTILHWEKELNCSNLSDRWPDICSQYSQMVTVRLRTFYLRFINRAYALNPCRVKWTPDITEKCKLCNMEIETFTHAYWKCTCIFHLWIKLIQWCRANVDATVNYSMENCLLLGFQKPVLNVIVTICKYHIHQLRYMLIDFLFDRLLE